MVDELRDTETELRSLWAELDSLKLNLKQTQTAVIDHAQRFDTLQSPWWNRVKWWVWDGWPWRDLNAGAPRWRPWFCAAQKLRRPQSGRRPCGCRDGD